MWFSNCFNNYNCNFSFMNVFNPFMNMMNFFMPSNNFYGYNMPINNIWQTQNYGFMPNMNNSIFQTNYNKNTQYNPFKGEILAQNVVAGLPTDRDPNNPLCARYVKNAMVNSGLGPYINGNGEFCKYIFRANPNFKEVKVKGEELSSLPKGSVVVYDANEQCTDNNGQAKRIGKDGHVTVALGDGKACSDVMEDEILKTDRAYVFIPV